MIKDDKNKKLHPSTELNWLQLEILSLFGKQPSYTSIIIEKLQDYVKIGKSTSVATFYNIIQRLKQKGFLENSEVKSGRGHKKYLQTSQLGKKELNKAIEWSLNILFEKIAISLIDDFQKICKTVLNCRYDTSILYLSPQLNVLKNFTYICTKCSNWNKINPRYLLSQSEEMISLDMLTINDHNVLQTNGILIPLPDNSLPRVISLFGLNLFADKDLEKHLSEIKRVLVKDGLVVFFVYRQMNSYVLDEITKLTGNIGLISSKFFDTNRIVQRYLDEDLAIDIIGNEFSLVKVQNMKEFIYIAAKLN